MIKYNGYSAECDSFEDLLKAINRLPDTIEYLKVQCSLQHFSPQSVKLQWSKDLRDKCEVIIDEALQEQQRFGFIDKFYLRSYFGEGKEDHSYYISLVSDESRAFGQRMAAGEYGSLD